MSIAEKHRIKNTVLNALVEGFWGFGTAFHSLYAIIPLFIKEMGAPAWVFGWLPGTMVILMALPQLLTTFRMHEIDNIIRKNTIMHYMIFFPVFAMAWVFGGLKLTGNTGLLVYIALFVIYTLMIGRLVPVWVLFLERISVENYRGRFLGITFMATGVVGFGGGAIAAYILKLEILQFPQNFGLLFFFYAVAILVGTSFFLGIKTDPERNTISRTKQSITDFFTEAVKILRENHQYRAYLISRVLFSAQWLVMAYYSVYGQDVLKFDISQAGIFTAITLVTSSVASVIAGMLGDRYGYKWIIGILYSSYLVAILLLISLSSMIQLYLIFVCIGIAQGSNMNGHMNMIIKYSRQQDTRIYYSIIETVQSIVLVLLMIAGTAIVATWGYIPLFVAAALFMISAFIVLIKSA